MGTLGCINDMQRRDKENRELRKLGRERIKDTRTRLSKIGKGTKLPEISAEEVEEIQRKTKEKTDMDNDNLFKTKIIIAVCVLFVFLLGCIFYYIVL